MTELTEQDIAEIAVLNHISKQAGETEREKGFREDWHLAAALDFLAERLMNVQDHIPDLDSDDKTATKEVSVGATLVLAANALRINIVGMKLMLAVSELAEGLDSLRDTGVSGHLMGDGNLGEELADAKVRIDSLSQLLRINIGDEQVRKMLKNKQRPHKHGRQV